MDCNRVQELIADGESLDQEDRAHLAACNRCGAVVEAWGQLDALLREEADQGVPEGFADRVMAAIDQQALVAVPRWFERPWVQVGLLQVGALVSLFNLFRFVLRVLVPSLSLGGCP
jgi:anti-sigma factor RsiW